MNATATTVEWSSKGWSCYQCGSEGHDYAKEFHVQGCDGKPSGVTMGGLANEVRKLLADRADYALIDAKVGEMERLAERMKSP